MRLYYSILSLVVILTSIAPIRSDSRQPANVVLDRRTSSRPKLVSEGSRTATSTNGATRQPGLVLKETTIFNSSLHATRTTNNVRPYRYHPVITNQPNNLVARRQQQNLAKPRQQQAHEDNQKMLCTIKLYVDTLVAEHAKNAERVDMNDRVVFLIPLIIIYWHHKHPREILPHKEIDNLLAEIGQEAQLHRRILDEVMKKAEHECVDEDKFDDTRTREQKKAAEALQILKNWLDESERLESQDDVLTGRQSGTRDMRHWFESLINLSKKTAANSIDKQRSNSSPATPTEAPVTITSLTISIVPTIPTEKKNLTDVSVAQTSEKPTVTTTEPYGWPHYNNGSITTESFNRGVSATEAPIQSASKPPDAFNMTLVNQLRDLEGALSPNGERTNLNASRASQYGSMTTEISDSSH